MRVFLRDITFLSRTAPGTSSELLFYTYPNGRLESVNGAGFEYDDAGNVTKNGYDDLEITFDWLNLPSQIVNGICP
jgi:hypothetical protein